MRAMTAFLAVAFKPFLAVLFLLIAWPFKRAVQLYMKDGKLKRFLLFSWKV
jgi:hypothetical protein